MNSNPSSTDSWFSSWFDTKYYHMLYKNRDENEAELFISNLYSFLNLSNESVLDLACGKGRHSLTLNKLGLKVLGVDLSSQSIACASQFKKQNLSFEVHDMREVIENNSFDVIFNLFTSFGYFDDENDNVKVLRSIYEMLQPNGLLVIDFMNVKKVLSNLVKQERKIEEGIEFLLTRNFDGRFITKDIHFQDDNKEFSFQERVRAFSYDHFHTMLKSTNFKIEAVFGDFKLNPFNEQLSDRLIIIARKL
jgi:2-polyprenyl-3-methyl-5-hydroxy-6-metoxy-1,4-benzoquinol methylase